MASEKWMIDANVMKHSLEAHIATAIYKGINNIPTSYESCNPTEYLKGYERGAIETANLALGQPQVDAEEVVRCKDCHWWRNINKKNGCGICTNEVFYIDGPTTAPVTEPDDFCSYGERRDGE